MEHVQDRRGREIGDTENYFEEFFKFYFYCRGKQRSEIETASWPP